ncbi:MAG: hypothetical protein K2J20_01095 [Bacilli bacterium]|nr:hypothetical protein [Bacilli bacterium]
MNKYEGISCADLIKEYIAHKTLAGYEPSCTKDEIRRYLEYINVTLLDNALQQDPSVMVEQFLNKDEKKQRVVLFGTKNKEVPVIEVQSGGLIVPTYALRYTSSGANGVGRFIDYFLKSYCKKRTLDDKSEEADERIANFGHNVSATMLLKIWNAITRKYILDDRWPMQCRDIKRYLLDIDLANIIDLPPLRDDLIKLYFTVANRVMSLAQDDEKFLMSHGSYQPVLNRANFDLAMAGFDNYVTWLDEFTVSLLNETIIRGTEVEPIAKPDVLKLVRELEEKEPNR